MARPPLSHLSPCPGQLWREPGTPGGSPGEAPPFHHCLCPLEGRHRSCCSARSSGFYK